VAPVALDFEPIVPLRTPIGRSRRVRRGYRLRLVDGPAVARNDPLLRALGAVVGDVRSDGDPALDDERFAPGRVVTPVVDDIDPDGEARVTIWSGDRRVRAGYLNDPAAAVVRAAVEHGVDLCTVVLNEALSLRGERLEAEVLFAPATTVELRDPGALPDVPGRARRPRRRLVLIFDESGPPRWWDPAGEAGPVSVTDLPMSSDLRAALRRLSDDWVRISEATIDASGFDGFDAMFDRQRVLHDARRLWLQARRELSREYLVGIREPGMDVPRWWPPAESSDEEIPF
jgi:hypothetical protein